MVESKHRWKAWLYLAPAIILLLIFTAWPIVNTLRMAFLEGYDLNKEIGGKTFEIGLGNFEKVINYGAFYDNLYTTIFLCVATVPISTLLALLIAVCLNSIKPFQRTLQTIFFLPYVTNSIAIGMVFAAMFNYINPGANGLADSYGIINAILGFIGLGPIDCMSVYSEEWANYLVLIVYIVWNALPFKILVLLGGLQGINKQYYDAAKVDGTSRVRVFTKITVPLLSPMLAYVVITSFIGGFKEYSSLVGIFGSSDVAPSSFGPNELNTMVGYIYRYVGRQQGQASAAALILFGIIFVVTMINLWVSKKKTHY